MSGRVCDEEACGVGEVEALAIRRVREMLRAWVRRFRAEVPQRVRDLGPQLRG